MVGITYDKERIHLNLARLKKGGETFEIDVDPDLAVELKEGKEIGLKEVLNAEKIFADAKKGMLAAEDKLDSTFGTTDVFKVARTIIEEGEIQLTAEHRAKFREAKRKRVLETIRKNGVDPRTHLPHPLQRIKNAFEEAKIKIDELRSVEAQIQPILKKLRPILPISFETKKIEIVLGPSHAHRANPILKKFGKMLSENWVNDGSLVCTVEIPAGMQEEFFDKLNSMTHGEVQTKIIDSE